MADEDSRVYIGAAPGGKDYDFDFDNDSPAPAPASASFQRPDVPAKPAVVVGIAAAQAKARREKRQSAVPPVGPSRQMAAMMPPPPTAKPAPPLRLPQTSPQAPLHLDASLDSLEEPPTSAARGGAQPPRSKPKTLAPQPGARRVPPPFNDEATRQVDEQVLASLRDLQKGGKPQLPKPGGKNHFDEPTRMANIDPRAFDETEHAHQTILDSDLPRRPSEDEATRMSNVDSLAAMGRARKAQPSRPPPPDAARPGPKSGSLEAPRPGPKSASRTAAKPPSAAKPSEDRTRAVDIRNDPSISDIDWDLD